MKQKHHASQWEENRDALPQPSFSGMGHTYPGKRHQRPQQSQKPQEPQEPAAPTEAELAKQSAVDSDQKRPGAYVSLWQQQLDAAMDKILNRESFSYDLNGDALYRQYKDRAMKDGRLAMLDTMGQAAALTGGYGSSYAQSVGQQAYQKQMDSLVDVADRLRNQAQQEYDRQGQALQERYDILRQRENGDYSQYRDQLGDWEAENQRLWQRYDNLKKQEYDAGRDAVKDQQWQAEFDEAKRQFYIQLMLAYGLLDEEEEE